MIKCLHLLDDEKEEIAEFAQFDVDVSREDYKVPKERRQYHGNRSEG